MVRELEAAKGFSIPKPFSMDELKYRNFQKKCIVASRSLSAGVPVGAEDVDFLKTGAVGLAPDQVHKVLGRSLRRDVEVYHVITEDELS
jgi:sialic acid synthase SpsE